MAKGTRTLAAELDTNRQTVIATKRQMGITGEMTEEQEQAVREKLDDNMRIKRRNKQLVDDLTQKGGFKSKVRRIDKKDGSSIRDMLQDAKERYVANEKVIEQLQAEIDAMDVLTLDNANGSMSTVPQLNAIQSFVKINITLRTQIATFEQVLEIGDEDEEDPFK